MDLLANLFGILGLLSNIIGIQLKKKKSIMLSFMFSTLFFSINFLLIKAYAGSVISFISTIETFINYCYDKKEKEYPLPLIYSYIFISLISGAFTYRSIIDILPVLSSIVFIFTIIQKKEKNIRFLTLIYMLLFVAYDYIVCAYMPLLAATIYVVSIIISIIRYDIMKKKIK